MTDKRSMKRTYCNKCIDSSIQQDNQVLSISFINNKKYWNLSIHSDQLNV